MLSLLIHVSKWRHKNYKVTGRSTGTSDIQFCCVFLRNYHKYAIIINICLIYRIFLEQ